MSRAVHKEDRWLMGFARFFLTSHPVTGFFFHASDDRLRGWLRRLVILSVMLVTFTLAFLNDEVFFGGEKDNTADDLKALKDDHRVTDHLIVTLVTAVALWLVDGILSLYFSIPTRPFFQGTSCLYLRWTIYMNALWLLIINVVLYVSLIWGQSAIFLGWLITYLLYSVIVAPILILCKWFCCGGKAEERLREIEEENNDPRVSAINFDRQGSQA